MKSYPIIILAFYIAVSLTSCINAVTGVGPVTQQTRDLPDFNKVALNINATLLVTQSSGQSILVHAQENLHDVIMTRVDGKTLVITTKGTVMNSKPILIEIGMMNLESFEVNGSGEIKALNTLQSEILDFEVNGSGSITADVTCSKISTAISGSGKLSLSGDAEVFDAEINGSGHMDAERMEVSKLKVKVSGSGQASVYATEKLNANINGSGIIKYKGTPHVKTDINGSGSVKAIN